MFTFFKPVALVALALAAGTAGATDIGFSGMHRSQSYSDYQENGYDVVALTANDLSVDNGWDGKFLETSGFTFSSTSGQSFDLNEFTLAFDSASFVALTYTVEGQAARTIFLDVMGEGRGTYDFGKKFDDLTSFSVAGLSRKKNGVAEGFLIDDIHVSLDAATPAVPEPASMALMLAGIGMIGLMARRRSV